MSVSVRARFRMRAKALPILDDAGGLVALEEPYALAHAREGDDALARHDDRRVGLGRVGAELLGLEEGRLA